jgi:Ser/Thr protein kinase RdoA (MazF antagonist)
MTTTYSDEFIEEMRRGLQRILHEWRMPPDSAVVLLNISENATYLVTAPGTGDKIILRIHRPDYHSKQEIESELLWVDSLRTQGVVSTAKPLDLESGGKISSLLYGEDVYFVVGFEFLSGTEPVSGNDLQQDFFTLGAITAKLHDHTKNWPLPIGFKRKIWDFDSMLGRHPLWGDWRKAIGLDPQGKTILEKTASVLQEQLLHYGKDKDKFGLIHADLRLSNLLVDGKKLSVIDFDDCGYSWRMYDFAAAISFMEEDEQIPELQNSWVKGYRSESPLSADDEAALPMFIMLRRILLTAWLASHSETETAQQLGSEYTAGTIRLAERYLTQFNSRN